MIVVALGANLDRADMTPRATLQSAVAALTAAGVDVTGQSRWYRSAPIPASAQPDYINGVVLVDTALAPWSLLAVMHRIEAKFGRVREERWGARTLDLDLIDYHGFITFNGWRGGRPGEAEPGALCLPHPRAHERAFVLRPLAEVAPAWRHPVLGQGAVELLRQGPVARQHCTPLPAGEAG